MFLTRVVHELHMSYAHWVAVMFLYTPFLLYMAINVHLSCMYLGIIIIRGFDDEDVHLELTRKQRASNTAIYVCDDSGIHQYNEVESQILQSIDVIHILWNSMPSYSMSH